MHRVDLVQDGACVTEDDFARRRELDALTGTQEENDTSSFSICRTRLEIEDCVMKNSSAACVILRVRASVTSRLKS